MHSSILSWFKSMPAETFTRKSVLEVGSYDVNGSVKPIVLASCPKNYVGVDMAAGSNVDYVVDAADLTRFFGYNKYDVVISCEMLEHAEDWKSCVNQMKHVLAPGGLLLISTRSEGFPWHGFPDDWWRFSVSDMEKIFMDFTDVDVQTDPEAPGVLVGAYKPKDRTEPVDLSYVSVFSMK